MSWEIAHAGHSPTPFEDVAWLCIFLFHVGSTRGFGPSPLMCRDEMVPAEVDPTEHTLPMPNTPTTQLPPPLFPNARFAPVATANGIQQTTLAYEHRQMAQVALPTRQPLGMERAGHQGLIASGSSSGAHGAPSARQPPRKRQRGGPVGGSGRPCGGGRGGNELPCGEVDLTLGDSQGGWVSLGWGRRALYTAPPKCGRLRP